MAGRITERICLGASAPEGIQCRPTRWFWVQKEGRPRRVLVCDSHLGWALARYGLPAQVDAYVRPDEDTRKIVVG